MAERIVRVKVELNTKEAEAAARKLGTDIEKFLRAGIKRASTVGAFKDITRAVDGTTAATKRTTKAAKENQTAWQQLTGAIGGTAKTALKAIATYQLMIGAFRSLATEVLSAYQASIEFDAGVRAVGKTTESVFRQLENGNFVLTDFGRELSQSILQLTRDIPVASAELNKLAAIGGQLGVAGDELAGFTELIAKLSATTNLVDVEQAATQLARFQNILQISQEDLQRFGSTLVDLGNNFAATESEILTASRRLGGIGQTAGLSADEIAALGVTLASLGTGLEASSTAVQRTLIEMITAVGTGGEKLELFAETAGYSADEFVQAWGSDPAQVFQDFIEGLGTQGTAAIGTLQDLGLGTQRTVRTLLALASSGDLLSDALDRASTAFSENTALQDEFALQVQGTGNQVQLLRNAWEEWKIAAVESGWVGVVAAGLTRILNGLVDVGTRVESTTGIINQLRDLAQSGDFDIGTVTGGVDQDGTVSIQFEFDDTQFNIEGFDKAKIASDALSQGLVTNQAELTQLLNQYDAFNAKTANATATAAEFRAELERIQIEEDLGRIGDVLGTALRNAIGSGDFTGIELSGLQAALDPRIFNELAEGIANGTLELSKLPPVLQDVIAEAFTLQSLDFADLLNISGFDLGQFGDQAGQIGDVANLVYEGALRLQDVPAELRRGVELVLGSVEGAATGIQELGENALSSTDVIAQAYIILGNRAAGADQILQNYVNTSNDVTAAQEEQAIALLTAAGYTEDAARALLGLEAAERGAGEEALLLADRMIAVSDAVRNTTIEAINAVGNFEGLGGGIAQSFLGDIADAGGSTEQILNAASAFGVLTDSQREQIEHQGLLAAQAQNLINAVADGNLTYEDAAILHKFYADTLGFEVEASTAAIDAQLQLAEAVRSTIGGMIDASTQAGALANALLNSGLTADLTSEQLIGLVSSTGALTASQQAELKVTVALTQEQQRLSRELEAGRITAAQAAQQFLEFAGTLKLAEAEMGVFSTTTSSFVSNLNAVRGAAGGAGGRVEQATSSFRDFYLELIGNEDALDSLDDLLDGFGRSLIDMSADAGASVTQLAALAVATGDLSEEQAQAIFRVAAAQAGIEELARQYVAGGLSAEEAAAGVATLREQIEAGQDVNLSEFGIDIGQLANATAQADAYAQSAGGAAAATYSWRDALLEASGSAGATAQAMLQLATNAGASAEEIRQALTDDALNRAAQDLAQQIADGLDPQEAIDAIEELEGILADLSGEEIAVAIDIAVAEGFNAQQFIEGLVPEALTVPVDPFSSFANFQTDVDANTTEASSKIEALLEAEREIALNADTTEAVEDINEVTEDADAYGIAVTIKDPGQLREDVEGVFTEPVQIPAEFDIQNLDELRDLPATPRTSPPGSPQAFARGGLIEGRSHAQGGEIINAEGGEYVVNKDAVRRDPNILPILEAINSGARPEDVIRESLDSLIPVGAAAGGVAEQAGFARTVSNFVSNAVNSNIGFVPPAAQNNMSIDQSSQMTQTVVNNYYAPQPGSQTAVIPGARFRG